MVNLNDRGSFLPVFENLCGRPGGKNPRGLRSSHTHARTHSPPATEGTCNSGDLTIVDGRQPRTPSYPGAAPSQALIRTVPSLGDLAYASVDTAGPDDKPRVGRNETFFFFRCKHTRERVYFNADEGSLRERAASQRARVAVLKGR